MDGFEKFWALYPRKVGKGAARKVWDKLKPDTDLQKKITLALDAQKRWRNVAKGEFLPEWKHPSTWLRGECWDDEIPSIAATLERTTEAVACGCGKPATVLGKCAWCYAKKHNPAHFQMLYKQLQSLGLGLREGESRADWIARCREYCVKTPLGRAIAARNPEQAELGNGRAR